MSPYAGGTVKRELPDRDPHAVGPEVAKPKDPGAIGDHDDVNVAGRPVVSEAQIGHNIGLRTKVST